VQTNVEIQLRALRNVTKHVANRVAKHVIADDTPIRALFEIFEHQQWFSEKINNKINK
jgi:hypothetical protein